VAKKTSKPIAMLHSAAASVTTGKISSGKTIFFT